MSISNSDDRVFESLLEYLRQVRGFDFTGYKRSTLKRRVQRCMRSRNLETLNEELETTNEELQSTNEELETMNEELQSSNEELQTINEELRQRTTELNHANAFLNSILASFQAGVVVINSYSSILTWNHQAEDMWGLRSEEVLEKSFFGLDIGLPVTQLRDVIRNCLAGKDNQEVIVSATNRRGRAIQCRVRCTPLVDPEQERYGVIMLMEEVSS